MSAGQGPSPFRTAPGPADGVLDYRILRRHLVAEYRRGRLARQEVCDAQPELVRAAREVGVPASEPCPICEADELVHVVYVFGPRLPAHGRCVTTAREMQALARRPDAGTCYVVEVCRSCRWNHLVRSFAIGRQRGASSRSG